MPRTRYPVLEYPTPSTRPVPRMRQKVEFFKDDTTRKCGSVRSPVPEPGTGFRLCGLLPVCRAVHRQPAARTAGPEGRPAQGPGGHRNEALLSAGLQTHRPCFPGGPLRGTHRWSERRAIMAVVLAAAYLHDIGIHEAEKKHNSTLPVSRRRRDRPSPAPFSKTGGSRRPSPMRSATSSGHHHHPGRRRRSISRCSTMRTGLPTWKTGIKENGLAPRENRNDHSGELADRKWPGRSQKNTNRITTAALTLLRLHK
jgi:hypothetical protein